MSELRVKKWGPVVGVVGVVMIVVLSLAGCAAGKDPRFTDVPGAPMASTASRPGASGAAETPPPAENPDILRAGDAVTIIFSDLPGDRPPPIDDRIKTDGTITLLLNKTFVAAGKTRRQLEQEIHHAYVPATFLRMTVSVKKTEQTQFYYVGGEVKQNGRQVYISRLTVLQAIQSAGGFTDFAKKRAVILTRADGRTITINCIKAQKRPELDLEVFPGDKITVPRRVFW